MVHRLDDHLFGDATQDGRVVATEIGVRGQEVGTVAHPTIGPHRTDGAVTPIVGRPLQAPSATARRTVTSRTDARQMGRDTHRYNGCCVRQERPPREFDGPRVR
jgi:hypothetical protein